MAGAPVKVTDSFLTSPPTASLIFQGYIHFCPITIVISSSLSLTGRIGKKRLSFPPSLSSVDFLGLSLHWNVYLYLCHSIG